MKKCSYCGRENEDAAGYCAECGMEFLAPEVVEPELTDPAAALVTLATFGDLIPATLLKRELEAAGIEACIPEDLAPNPFGNFIPVAHITVQVAARDYDAAKEIRTALESLPPPKDDHE